MQMKNKWTFIDILVLCLEIAIPIISIVITCAVPQGRALDSDIKLAIIGGGISIPIVLLQISVTVGQNSNDRCNDETKTAVMHLSEQLNHISPILEKVFLSQNDRIKRFVYRRMEEVTKTINAALSNNNSGELRPSEYYEELLYLADMIIRDRDEHKKKFTGEIWAMTSFAEDEWIADEGYERLWTEKLKSICDKGIKTRRLCIVPDTVYNIISDSVFTAPQQNANNSFWGFISLLEMYYSNSVRKKTSEHYFLRENDNTDLTDIKGFFAIKLTNGELNILHGETVDKNGALTAKVLFNPDEIQELRNLFERYATQSYRMEKVISDVSKQNLFVDYLKRKNIDLT